MRLSDPPTARRLRLGGVTRCMCAQRLTAPQPANCPAAACFSFGLQSRGTLQHPNAAVRRTWAIRRSMWTRRPGPRPAGETQFDLNFLGIPKFVPKFRSLLKHWHPHPRYSKHCSSSTSQSPSAQLNFSFARTSCWLSPLLRAGILSCKMNSTEK